MWLHIMRPGHLFCPHLARLPRFVRFLSWDDVSFFCLFLVLNLFYRICDTSFLFVFICYHPWLSGSCKLTALLLQPEAFVLFGDVEHAWMSPLLMSLQLLHAT